MLGTDTTLSTKITCWKLMKPKLSMNTGTDFPFKVALRLNTDKPKRGCLPPTRILALKDDPAKGDRVTVSGPTTGWGGSITIGGITVAVTGGKVVTMPAGCADAAAEPSCGTKIIAASAAKVSAAYRNFFIVLFLFFFGMVLVLGRGEFIANDSFLIFFLSVGDSKQLVRLL